jgi:O-antigen ligase
MDPHNNALKIAAEMGIPALAVFVLVIGLCFLRGYRLYRKVDDPFLKAMVLGYVGSVVGLFVANLFGSRLDSEEITTQFWAMTACVMLLWQYEHVREAEAALPEATSDEA